MSTQGGSVVLILKRAQPVDWPQVLGRSNSNSGNSNQTILSSVRRHDASEWPITSMTFGFDQEHNVSLLEVSFGLEPLPPDIEVGQELSSPSYPKLR